MDSNIIGTDLFVGIRSPKSVSFRNINDEEGEVKVTRQFSQFSFDQEVFHVAFNPFNSYESLIWGSKKTLYLVDLVHESILFFKKYIYSFY